VTVKGELSTKELRSLQSKILQHSLVVSRVLISNYLEQKKLHE